MNKALLALLEKKDIEFITVTELANKAGVSRSTFYLHYDNMYELLEETIENLNKQFISSFNVSFP
jgi:AcrR family transcriptional regulator